MSAVAEGTGRVLEQLEFIKNQSMRPKY
jgi:hypothetical protein